MKGLLLNISRILREQAGFTLFETLLAVAILGVIGVGIINSVGASYRSTGVMDERVTAVNIATACIEALNEAVYSPTGDYSLSTPPLDEVEVAPHYSVTFETECSSDGNNFVTCNGSGTLQNVRISVLHDEKLILFMCTFKSDF